MEHSDIKGFTDQSEKNKEIINGNKVLEERMYRRIDNLAASGVHDADLLASAHHYFVLAYMLLNRAVFQPQRIELPEDKPDDAAPLPPVHIGEVFRQYHKDLGREVVTDNRGDELEAVGPHWYKKVELDAWRNLVETIIPTTPIPPTEHAGGVADELVQAVEPTHSDD